jgi:caa(3)-type oxidase subunit IV
MTDHAAHAPDHGASQKGPHVDSAYAHHGDAKFYIKMWGVLCVLLVISVLGPMLGHKAITLITAFGIAGVKAYIVCAYFMHLKFERRYAVYLLITVLLLVGLFWGGVAGDVMNHQGQNWNNVAAKAETARALKMIEEAAKHGGAHGAAPGEHGAKPAHGDEHH